MKQYYSIDYIKMRKEGLNATEWILLENIHFRQAITESGYCEDTRQELADWFGLSYETIKKSISKLVKNGWLKTNKKHQPKTTPKYHKMMQEMISEKERNEGVKKYPQDKNRGYKNTSNGGKKIPLEGVKKYPVHTIYSKNTERDRESVATDENLESQKTDSLEVAEYLLNKILSFKPNFKQPNLNTWAKDIDKAMRLDKRTKQELIACIDWIYTKEGSFWTPNILSGKKLREKFDIMEAQMLRNSGASTKHRTQQAIDEFARGA